MADTLTRSSQGFLRSSALFFVSKRRSVWSSPGPSCRLSAAVCPPATPPGMTLLSRARLTSSPALPMPMAPPALPESVVSLDASALKLASPVLRPRNARLLPPVTVVENVEPFLVRASTLPCVWCILRVGFIAMRLPAASGPLAAPGVISMLPRRLPAWPACACVEPRRAPWPGVTICDRFTPAPGEVPRCSSAWLPARLPGEPGPFIESPSSESSFCLPKKKPCLCDIFRCFELWNLSMVV